MVCILGFMKFFIIVGKSIMWLFVGWVLDYCIEGGGIKVV